MSEDKNGEWKPGDADRRSKSISETWVIGILVVMVGALLALGVNNLQREVNLNTSAQNAQGVVSNMNTVKIEGIEKLMAVQEKANDQMYSQINIMNNKIDKILEKLPRN